MKCEYKYNLKCEIVIPEYYLEPRKYIIVEPSKVKCTYSARTTKGGYIEYVFYLFNDELELNKEIEFIEPIIDLLLDIEWEKFIIENLYSEKILRIYSIEKHQQEKYKLDKKLYDKIKENKLLLEVESCVFCDSYKLSRA